MTIAVPNIVSILLIVLVVDLMLILVSTSIVLVMGIVLSVPAL